MPKIVINEIDNTTAGTSEYANFSVVVPGYLAEDKYTTDDGKTVLGSVAKTVFDENGIYECTSQTDFNTYIGKRSSTILTAYETKAAEPPKIKAKFVLNTAAEGTKFPIMGTIDMTTYTYTTYTYKDASDYTVAINSLASKKFDFAKGEVLNTVSQDKDYDIYYAIPNLTQKVGHLRDSANEYLAVSTSESTLESLAMPTYADETLNLRSNTLATRECYYVIDNEEVGNNGIRIVDEITHYGNQMAYELLGLGYTVLFKYMTPFSKEELENMAVGKADSNGNQQVEESAVCELDELAFWNCLKDKSTYDFRYIVTGLLTNNDDANKCIKKIADHSEEIRLDDASTEDGRGDCIALIDLDKTTYEGKSQSNAIEPMATAAAKFKSAYVAIFAPYVDYNMTVDKVYKNTIFPASFHYLACAARSANSNYNEWYANAGYTRGVSSYSIKATGCKFGEIAIQALEPRFKLKVGSTTNTQTEAAVNLIVNIKGSYYLWGNRTGKELGTRYAEDGDLVAQHFLNIRQLCTTIKKQVYVTCRRLTFDPNSNILWINFRSLLTPMLEQMKADQGIRDYEFIRNDTARKALLSAKIRIVPIEAVEDFEIDLCLEDSLSEVAVTEA
jgi:hypothetical protein